jgi:hypothetical protein
MSSQLHECDIHIVRRGADGASGAGGAATHGAHQALALAARGIVVQIGSGWIDLGHGSALDTAAPP